MGSRRQVKKKALRAMVKPQLVWEADAPSETEPIRRRSDGRSDAPFAGSPGSRPHAFSIKSCHSFRLHGSRHRSLSSSLPVLSVRPISCAPFAPLVLVLPCNRHSCVVIRVQRETNCDPIRRPTLAAQADCATCAEAKADSFKMEHTFGMNDRTVVVAPRGNSLGSLLRVSSS